jgi:hypothetical protein
LPRTFFHIQHTKYNASAHDNSKVIPIVLNPFTNTHQDESYGLSPHAIHWQVRTAHRIVSAYPIYPIYPVYPAFSGRRRRRPQLTAHSHRFINNEWVKGVDGKTFETINPSTEEVICSVHEATEKDVDIAVAAARKAFEGSWRKETPENRGKLLVNLANLIEKNTDLLAAVESLDNGKAIGMAKVDVSMVAGCLRYYGGWADKIEGKVIDTNSDTFAYTRQEPVSNQSIVEAITF